MLNHIYYDFPKLDRVTNPDGSRLYSTPSGSQYPSVTTITGLLSKRAIIEWRKRVGEEVASAISSKASKRGTAIHKYFEDYLNNKIVMPNLVDVPMWNSLTPLLPRINNIHCLETSLYSDHLRVAGTVDCIAEFDGKLSVIDFKTSSKIKTRDNIQSYFMQCSAYAVAFEERTGIPVSKIVILMGVDNEKPLVFTEKRDSWISGFKALRAEYDKTDLTLI